MDKEAGVMPALGAAFTRLGAGIRGGAKKLVTPGPQKSFLDKLSPLRMAGYGAAAGAGLGALRAAPGERLQGALGGAGKGVLLGGAAGWGVQRARRGVAGMMGKTAAVPIPIPKQPTPPEIQQSWRGRPPKVHTTQTPSPIIADAAMRTQPIQTKVARSRQIKDLILASMEAGRRRIPDNLEYQRVFSRGSQLARDFGKETARAIKAEAKTKLRTKQLALGGAVATAAGAGAGYAAGKSKAKKSGVGNENYSGSVDDQGYA